MKKELHEDAKVIDDLGGPKDVSEMLRTHLSQIYVWRREGLPDSRRQTLALLYKHLPRDWLPVKPRKRRGRK